MTTANTFTEQQVQDYLDRHIEKINRKAFAYQDVLLNVQKEGDSFEQSMDWESFEDIQGESQDIFVYIAKEAHSEATELMEFRFRNLQDEELGQLLIDTFIAAGLPEDKRTILELMFNLEREYNIPDTVVIDITGGVVDEISTNVEGINVVVLDAELDGLDDDDLKRAIQIADTVYVPHNTSLPELNLKRVNDIHLTIQQNKKRLVEEALSSLELSQEDYDRFNEFFRVETHALGRSVIKPALRGLEYVDEEVYGTEEEIRLIPLKVLGQQFDMVEPVTKPVAEMIADYVKLSKLHKFDAQLIRQHFIEK